MALPPGVTEIGRTAAPGGGYWILGSDGGVFAEGTPEHFGSYWSIDAVHRNDPNRKWQRIETTEQGGYRIVSTNQEKYEFNPTGQQARTGVTPPPANPTATTPAPSGPSGADADARAVLNEMLSEYGLEGLGDWVWNEYQSTQSTALVQTRLRDRPEYKQRFPAMELRKAAGLRPLTEKEYIDFENQAEALMRDYDLPKGFYDDKQKDMTQFLANDVSVQEMQSRIQDGYAAAMAAPAEWRDEVTRLFGVGPGGLAAFFLDPDRSTDLLMRNWAEAQISGEAVRTGFGGLSQDEATRMRSLGISAQAAAERFGTLAQSAQITGQLPGEQEAAMSREAQLGLVTNTPSGQEEMRQRQRRRTAAFEGGGSFAGGQGGLSGLGEAG